MSLCQGAQLHTHTHVYMHLCSGLLLPLAPCHSVPRIISVNIWADWSQQAASVSTDKQEDQEIKEEAAPKCKVAADCASSLSVFWVNLSFSFIYFYSVSPSVHSQRPGVFCNQSVWRNAPSLLLWRLNSARCQFEMNCEERSRRPACKGGGGGWAAVEEIRRNYQDGGWDKKKEKCVGGWGPEKNLLFVPQEMCSYAAHFPTSTANWDISSANTL